MSDSVRKGLLGAYRRLMRPLVRILIRNGISYAEFAEVLKNVFVEVAECDFGIPHRRISQSRIAILTGLTRKEVARQKAILDNGDFDLSGNLNRVTRVLVGWHTDPQYTGPYGLPVELPFDSESGGVSFCDLVRRYSGDMAPRAMLDELLRVGAVEPLASGTFKVLQRAYIPDSLHPDQLQRLGEVVSNFINTVDYNMSRTDRSTGRFERVVYADTGLDARLLPAFERLLQVKGQQLLVELDNWLSSQETTSPAPRYARHVKRIKTGVGIYHYIDET